jgi:hypothetical protein
MLKSLLTGVVAILIAGSSPAYAEQAGAQSQQERQGQERLSPADRKAMTDMRIGVIKAALQLKPDQEKYWPAVEDAIRARATMRDERWAALRARMEKGGDPQPIDVMRAHADALTQRGEALRKLADAWQPLYASLDEDQKRRMRFLVEHVFYMAREAMENRHMDEEYDEE